MALETFQNKLEESWSWQSKSNPKKHVNHSFQKETKTHPKNHKKPNLFKFN